MMASWVVSVTFGFLLAIAAVANVAVHVIMTVQLKVPVTQLFPRVSGPGRPSTLADFGSAMAVQTTADLTPWWLDQITRNLPLILVIVAGVLSNFVGPLQVVWVAVAIGAAAGLGAASAAFYLGRAGVRI
jgi:hypothetical protein